VPIPRVAIVGRPNAGKSSLMNMIAGSKVSIVDPTPGVTRDRVAAIVHLPHPDNRGPSKAVEFVDTGGFGVYVAEGARYDEVGADLATLTDSIESQIAQAVTNADVILLAIDCQQGLTPADEEIARLLREQRLGPGAKKHGKVGGTADTHKRAPVLVVATKCDGPKWEAHALELASLGFGEPLMCSSKSNYFRREFLDAIYNTVPTATPDESKTAFADLKMAIIGKRNAGKSTLVNTLAGEPRMIVSEIAGTTRDAVDVRFEMDGRTLIAIDTAGLRRKRSFQNMVEHYAYDRAIMAIDRADVVVLMIDATEKISQVDEQLASLCQKSYKPVIIALNKWDLAEGRTDDRGRPASPDRYEEYLRKELRALPFAPIAFISGETGRNVRALVDVAFDLHEQSRQRVTTGKLNRLCRDIITRQGPTDIKGTQAKVYYVAQTGVQPATITLVVNHPELFTPNYLRFLMNRFREELPFPEVPIRIVVRARRQREDDMSRTADGAEPLDQVRTRGRQMSKTGEAPPALVAEEGEYDEELLSDSESVEVQFESDDADDYFIDDEE